MLEPEIARRHDRAEAEKERMPRLDNLDINGFTDSLQNHRASPSVSASEHLLGKMRTLAAWVLKRKRMYLDTCWWIRLRDVKLGRSKDVKYDRLLLRLLSLVQSGDLICPIGESVFLELLKQGDVA